jgi:hypothetical protein
MEKPIIIPSNYSYKQIADFAYIAESLGGFDFMSRDNKSKWSLNQLCPNSTQLQVKYNNFENYLENLGITLEKFKKLDIKRYFSLRKAGVMRHSSYLANVFFRFYNPKLTEKLYEYYETFQVNGLTKPGVKTFFNYSDTQIKAIERAYGFGKHTKILSNIEYDKEYSFKESSATYILFTRFSNIRNEFFQHDNLNIEASIQLTGKLMLLVIDRKEDMLYSEFLKSNGIKDAMSEIRYKSLITFYKRYRSLISRYREIVDDLNGDSDWKHIFYKYDLESYGLESKEKFIDWLDRMVPIKALVKPDKGAI